MTKRTMYWVLILVFNIHLLSLKHSTRKRSFSWENRKEFCHAFIWFCYKLLRAWQECQKRKIDTICHQNICPHISRPHFSPLKSHFYMFVDTLLPLAARKCFLYHLIAMLKCFPKRVSQRKSIFEHFSPHYVKIIQNFFIATWMRNVAKVLRCTFALIKRGRTEGQKICFSLSLSQNKPFPSLQHDLNEQEMSVRTYWNKTSSMSHTAWLMA